MFRAEISLLVSDPHCTGPFCEQMLARPLVFQLVTSILLSRCLCASGRRMIEGLRITYL